MAPEDYSSTMSRREWENSMGLCCVPSLGLRWNTCRPRAILAHRRLDTKYFHNVMSRSCYVGQAPLLEVLGCFLSAFICIMLF